MQSNAPEMTTSRERRSHAKARRGTDSQIRRYTIGMHKVLDRWGRSLACLLSCRIRREILDIKRFDLQDPPADLRYQAVRSEGSAGGLSISNGLICKISRQIFDISPSICKTSAERAFSPLRPVTTILVTSSPAPSLLSGVTSIVCSFLPG